MTQQTMPIITPEAIDILVTGYKSKVEEDTTGLIAETIKILEEIKGEPISLATNLIVSLSLLLPTQEYMSLLIELQKLFVVKVASMNQTQTAAPKEDTQTKSPKRTKKKSK